MADGRRDGTIAAEFSRIYLAGWTAIFTSTLLHSILERSPHDRTTRNAFLVMVNFVLTAAGAYVPADAAWS